MNIVKLKVAEVRYDLGFDCVRPQFATLYQPFLLASEDDLEPQLQLTFSNKIPKKTLQAFPPLTGACATVVSELSTGFRFCRSEGEMLTNEDFSSCRANHQWRKGLDLTEPFLEGASWVLLALWGWFSLHGGALLHGSLTSIDGQLVLFLGDSGVGKTTLSKLAVGAGHSCLTEENPLLTWKEGTPWVHGMPWPGFMGPPVPLSGPLKAIFFLHHSPQNKLHKLSLQESGRRLLGNARFFSWLPKTIPPTIDLLDQTVGSVPAYDLGFVPDLSAITLIREVL